MIASILMSILLVFMADGVMRNPSREGWWAVIIHLVSTLVVVFLASATEMSNLLGFFLTIPILWMLLLLLVMWRYVMEDSSVQHVFVFTVLSVTFGFIISNIVRIS